MKNDPYETTAKFPSTCAESGEPIKRHDPIIVWPSGRVTKVYKVGSAPKAEQAFREFLSLSFEEDNGYCTY